MRASRSFGVAALAVSLLAGAMVGVPPAAASGAVVPSSPDRSVPVKAGAGRAAQPSQTDGASVKSAGPSTLPSAASVMVPTSGAAADVGGLPVAASVAAGATDDVLWGGRVSSEETPAGPATVRVTTADPAVARAAGVRGVVLSVSRVDGSAPATAAMVKLRVGYSAWAGLFGANFGDRLRMVALPGCALSTPEVRKCQEQRPLRSVNAFGDVLAEVGLPGSAGAQPVVLAVTSSSASAGATFTETSLSPAYSWSAGGQGGSFSWSYPLKVPPSLGGPAPELAVTYDSGSVDAQTLSQNGQTSWVGEGWDLSTGYVERSYRACGQDGRVSGDLCWFSTYNATLVFQGKSYKLIYDELSQSWKTDDDNALRVEQVFDAPYSNDDNDGEYWKVTAQDGTQYFFGKHRRYPGDPQATDSVQTVPVFGNNPGEPCYNSTPAYAWCWQGYRWNLDYVVDPRGNSMTYFYTEFLGNYGIDNNAVGMPYVISSTLDHIDYGTRAGSEGASAAPMQVWFAKTNRCVGGCSTGEYPDTPWDLHCPSEWCPNLTSPAYWSPYKLSSVRTQVRKADGSGYRKVDQWDLTHSYPATGDFVNPVGNDTTPNLWLDTLTHTGFAEDGLAMAAEPAITFGGTGLFNRVDWGNVSGTAPYNHFRLTSILNGVGGQTVVAYSGVECQNGAYKPPPGFNPLRCFPQYHKPFQAESGWDWFNKYVVTSVSEKDLTAGGSPANDETWSYTYSAASSTDTSLWAHDYAETTVLDFRSWSSWRGYTDVTTTHGPVGGTQTVSKGLFHRGMDGDSLATWDNQAMVWESRRAGLFTPIGAPGTAAHIGGTGGRCLDAVGGGTANGTLMQLWDCNGGANQVWKYNLDTTSPEVFMLKNPASNRCLTIHGGVYNNGTAVDLWDCIANGANQKWRFGPNGTLINPASGKCLDVSGANPNNGAVIHLWDCGAWAPHQVWRFRADGSLFNPQTERCMDISGGVYANGRKIANWSCLSGFDNQVWQYSPTGSSLKNPASGKCVDITGGGTANGTLVQLWDCTNGASQLWVPQADGSLRNPNSGRCLDAANPIPESNAQLVIRDCNGGPTQRWAHHITDSTALQGKSREDFTMEGSTVVESAIHTYKVSTTGLRSKPVVGGQDLKSFMARETDIKTRTWIQATGTWRWTNLQTVYDTYGLPTDIKNLGDMSITTDDTCAHMDYNRNTNLHLISLPKQTLTTDCTPTPGDNGFVDGVHLYYDNATTDAVPTKGLVTKTTVLAAVAGGVQTWKQSSRAAYDTYGRATTLFDAIDRRSTTAYAPSAGAPVTSTAQTGPMGAGWTTTTTIDPGHGNVTSITDINGKVSTAHYDALGRLVKVWADDRPTSQTPDRQHTYTLASPSWTHTQTLGPNGNQISSYQIFDGRMRTRQTQMLTQDGKRTVSDTQYDSRGLVAKNTVFYNNASGPSSTLATFNDTAVDSQTRYVYDDRGRKTKDQLYKNNVLQWESETRYSGDRTGVIPPAGGTAAQDLYDALGRLIERRLYSGTPFTGAFDKTVYSYDRSGRLISAKDPSNNQWTYQYDLRGRQTQTTDPDAGTTITTYDDAGQVTSTTDSRGQALFHKYDTLGRPTELRQDSLTGPLRASWTYDTLVKGQPTSSSRHQDGQTYTMTVGAYNDAYQPENTTYTVPGFGAGGTTLTYNVANTYKVNGAPATAHLPAIGGLPAELLTAAYDNAGLAQQLTSDQHGTLIDARTYTFDGLTAEAYLGAPSGNQARMVNTYDPATRRLAGSRIDTKTGSTWTLARTDDTYSYDPAGNVTSIAGKTEGVADQEECFRHDHLRRLREAWTQTSGACTTPQRTGTDPYWRQWTFDTIGNRLTHTDKNPTTGDTTWTSTVGAAGTVRPHQVKTITATGANPTPTRTFSYDNAGNTLTATTPTGAAQTLTWDPEGHLATVTEGSNITSYIYDAGGNRLVAAENDKKTLYLPDGTELLIPNTGATLATRYYAGVAVRDHTGLRWTTANHQGTGITQIDPATLQVTRQRFMPYGESRGTQAIGWKGSKGFVGGTKDPTGYTHLGAREYDPTSGRFISVDPVMDLTDPQQWNAYAYAHNNPVTDSDPSGLIPACGNDMGGCNGTPTGPDEETDSAHEPAQTTPTGPSAAEQAAAAARAAAEAAERARKALIGAAKELLDIAMEELGITAALDCFTTGNLGSCLETGLNIASSFVGGLAGKLLAKYGAPWKWAKAAKLVKRIWGALERIVTGVRDWITNTKLARRLAAAAENLADACHSFAAGTLVLMADGTTKPIQDVDIGDQVVATDPDTGETTTKQVTELHTNQDRDLAQVTIHNDQTGQTTTLHTTSNHPFWNATDHEWTNAADLTSGDRLRDNEGKQTQQVVAVRTLTGLQPMHDLTIADIHTYYVIAGSTPVLVHNCNNVISNADKYDNTGALGAHENGTAFSGIYEPSTGNFRAHLSVDPDLPNPPVNSVRRLGGHGQINFEHFGGSRETVGFTMFQEEGGFSVSWMSRSVNGRNHGNPLAPLGARQSIMDAIAAATGRKVWSR